MTFRSLITAALAGLFLVSTAPVAAANPAALSPGADAACPYGTVGMLVKYRGEERSGGYYVTAVAYLDDEQRRPYQVFVDDGLLVDAHGQPIDAEHAEQEQPDFTSLQAIYVMDDCGRIFLTYHHEVGLFHHSSFLAGAPIAAAGEMLVIDGRILELDAASGHYRPPQAATEQIIHRLKLLGADLSMAAITP